MNKDSSINSITKAQNITQAITNTNVPPTPKENIDNPILKMKVILTAENLQNRSNQMKILNLKRVSHNMRRQYDQTHKRMGNSKKTKTRMQSFCEKLPRINYSMYGYT